MSAICGIYHPDGKPVPPEDLDRMMGALSDYGPDGAGVWREGPVALSRLAGR